MMRRSTFAHAVRPVAGHARAPERTSSSPLDSTHELYHCNAEDRCDRRRERGLRAPGEKSVARHLTRASCKETAGE
ncbi:hypothetical protein ON010_g5741 [Phytophthora cinnamomi]|nr:hypothetical protein ON010_g5741 [Phytophthora cinnamomi]